MLNNITKLLTSPSHTGPGYNNNISSGRAIVYSFSKNENIQLLSNKKNATVLLKYFFASLSCFISKPTFVISPEKVKIHLCFYKPTNVILNKEVSYTANSNNHLDPLAGETVNSENDVKGSQVSQPYGGKEKKILKGNFKYLGYMLAQLFNREVELELVPLQYPYLDSNILAQLIARNSNKYNFNKMLSLLFKRAYIMTNKTQINNLFTEENNISSVGSDLETSSLKPVTQLTGIRIKFAGRLASQKIVPKTTVKTAYKGNLSGKNNIVDSATFTSKNKIGAYTVTVTLGHKITN